MAFIYLKQEDQSMLCWWACYYISNVKLITSRILDELHDMNIDCEHMHSFIHGSRCIVHKSQREKVKTYKFTNSGHQLCLIGKKISISHIKNLTNDGLAKRNSLSIWIPNYRRWDNQLKTSISIGAIAHWPLLWYANNIW